MTDTTIDTCADAERAAVRIMAGDTTINGHHVAYLLARHYARLCPCTQEVTWPPFGSTDVRGV